MKIFDVREDREYRFSFLREISRIMFVADSGGIVYDKKIV